jgi:hypothetical protein
MMVRSPLTVMKGPGTENSKNEGSMLKKVFEIIFLLKPSYALIRMGYVDPASVGFYRLTTLRSSVPL